MTDTNDELIVEPTGSYLTFVGGRKFILSMISVLCTSVLCWFGKIDPGVFSVVMVATISAYMAGNVLQKEKS